VIHHVSFMASDVARSGRFYDAVLGPLGWRRLVDTSEQIGWGIVKPVFFVSDEGAALAGGCRVCFSANAIPAVRAAWEGGVATGGEDDGTPGNRPEYGPNRYSAFLRDPDGHRVEVVVSTD
jgi:catechol 2,3-dioxygenase-like lactoylglutathione lyase family enzyme